MKLVILLLTLPILAAAQPVVIEGDVVNALTGAPIPGAHVSTFGTSTVDLIVVKTDAAGHFRLSLAPTPWGALDATSPGFLRRQISLPRSPSSSLRIELTPAAVISGVVEDEEGQPIERALVQLVCRCDRQRPQELIWSAMTQADDLGRYRFPNITSGRYWIHVSPGDILGNFDSRYVPRYHPEALQADESNQIILTPGQHRDHVDVRLSRYQGASISGRVTAPDGLTLPRFVVLDASSGITAHFDGVVRPDGSFVIRHLPPGRYSLLARSGNYPPAAGDLLASLPVEVATADIRDLAIALHEVKPVDLPGTVALDGGNPSQVSIHLRTMFGPGFTAQAGPDGAFVLKNLLPGHYDISVLQSNGGMLFPTSVMLGDKELPNSAFDLEAPPAGPLHITVTTHLIELTGKLQDAAGHPLPEISLSLEGTATVHHAYAQTDAEGNFRFRLTHPGDYRLVRLAPNGEPDPTSFPPVKVIDGKNPSLVLIAPAKK